LRKWSREIAEAKEWTTVRQGVEAKLCVGPQGAETFVLCRSMERRAKEQAMHDLFAQRIELGLGTLGERLKHARKALERGKLERQIGRLLGRNTRAVGRYLVDLVEDATVAAGLRLQWSVKPEWDDRARQQRRLLRAAHQYRRLER
jgi:hypothetical protein